MTLADLTRRFWRRARPGPVPEPQTAVLRLPPPTGRHHVQRAGRHRAPDAPTTPTPPRGHWASPAGQWTIAHPVLSRDLQKMQGDW